jgi:superfamily II DNA or RNA helicase
MIGGSGDLGADVVGTSNGQRWLLQSKYRGSGSVDASALQEAVRAMTAYGADVAVAATNQRFADDAFRYLQGLKATNIDARLWDGEALLGFFRGLPDQSAARPSPREYQSEAVEAVESFRSRGARTALVLMATGLGKTVVAGELIASELSRNPSGEVLVLAHMVELVLQLERSTWPSLGKDVTTHVWSDGEEPAYAGGITFATWQSVVRQLEQRNLAGRYGLVVVDEAHHAASSMYRQLIDGLQPNFLLGLTATPWRGDKLSIGEIFGEPAFSMDIIDGMQRGFLADVDYRMLVDDIDWDEVRNLSRQGYTLGELNRRLLLPDRDQALVQTVVRHMGALANPRVIGFCRSIDHAERLRALFLSENVRAGLLHSALPRPERFDALAKFRTGQFELLLSVDMLNEGIDVPEVNMVAFMRVTHSRRIFVQQLGRGLRIAPGKRQVLVLDFVADIRRAAAGLELNKQAKARGQGIEHMRFEDGRVVSFSNDEPANFFAEYLEDVAAIEHLTDTARLAFPP